MAETVRCKVVGDAEVLGVAAPGEVELDSGLYNVDALVSAGHVEVLDAPQPEPGETDAAARRARRAAGTAES